MLSIVFFVKDPDLQIPTNPTIDETKQLRHEGGVPRRTGTPAAVQLELGTPVIVCLQLNFHKRLKKISANDNHI